MTTQTLHIEDNSIPRSRRLRQGKQSVDRRECLSDALAMRSSMKRHRDMVIHQLQAS